ncbi:MAG: DUF1559 domain-containing protein [Planctomycetaceae bacterium]
MNAQRGDSHDDATSKPQSKFGCISWGVVVLLVVAVIYLLMPPIYPRREAAYRSQCKNNLKQIGLALHNYHDQYQEFPPAYTVDEHGKPLHSWRTLILPFIDQELLYQKIDLSKPWNHPVNISAFKAVVPVYECPSVKSEPGMTNYLAVTGENTGIRPERSLKFKEMTDGSSNTLAVVEVNPKHAVHWMSPHDADLALLLGLSREKDNLQHTGGYHVLLFDGSVRYLSIDIQESILRALVSASGNDEVGEF